MRSTELGIITSGVVYEYVREALPEASILKIVLSFPLPAQMIRTFAHEMDRVVVVEEADAYLETHIRALGVALEQAPVPGAGELSPGLIAQAFGAEKPEMRDAVEGLPARPPLMCPGCPHRGLYYALRSTNAVVTGDIGCYTLGALPPLSQMDSCVDMGASIGMMHGMNLAGGVENRPVVSVIGDSTFAHSGITGLANLAYNAGTGVVIILDNRITAMTGHQGNPLMGRTLMGEQSTEIDLEKLCEALGIVNVRTVDPHDIEATRAVLREEVKREGLSVVISRAPCALLIREKDQPFAVNAEACTACGACIKLGCPAISLADDARAEIDTTLCVGCEQCVNVCRFDAIESAGPACDIGGV
jgi:indolepyruvate ferredoxin oxidoreductase alpha subunit